MFPADVPMPLDLKTPVVISHSLDGIGCKTDASITQTLLNLQTEFRNLQIPPELYQIYMFLTLGRSQEARLTLFNVRQRTSGPTDTAIKQPTASLSHQAMFLNYSVITPCFCIPRKLQTNIFVFGKRRGVGAHIFRVGVLFVSLHKQNCIHVKIKKQ